MKLAYVLLGAIVALFPFASFLLVGIEVLMVFQISKKHDAVNVLDLAWFCLCMILVSVFLKFIALWLHAIPVLGQISNSLVAAGFIYFVYDVADAHYAKVAKKQ
jgi:hypothetical protein